MSEIMYYYATRHERCRTVTEFICADCLQSHHIRVTKQLCSRGVSVYQNDPIQPDILEVDLEEDI
jgi:hypothetical protein